MAQVRLILASSSPYRQALLTRLGLQFEAIAPNIDESPLPGEAPEQTALRLAQIKASVVVETNLGALVIGSDQVATLDGHQIGKPGDHARAFAQLQSMRGREVIFHTALCLIDSRPGAQHPLQIENVQTRVHFRDLPDAELDAYLKIEQPYDCAGSAKNEALGIALIDSLSSTDPNALTGLPLIALVSMLRKVGVSFFDLPQQAI
jgi:septum formation protein